MSLLAPLATPMELDPEFAFWIHREFVRQASYTNNKMFFLIFWTKLFRSQNF